MVAQYVSGAAEVVVLGRMQHAQLLAAPAAMERCLDLLQAAHLA